MDSVTVASTTHRGMQAWLITGAELEIVVTVIGAHLAVIRSRGENLNPLWQPLWPATDPATVSRGGFYGRREAKVLANIVGHNLCIDRFGASWPGENRPMHGEGGGATWSLTQPAADQIELTTWLPEAQLRVRRLIQMHGNSCHYTAGVCHDGPAVRTVEWCEHVTLGDPFLDGVRITAGVDRVFNGPSGGEEGSRFTQFPPEVELPIAAVLAVPALDDAPCGDVASGRVTDGWWTAENPRLKRRLTYSWNAQQFPWLALWTQHRQRKATPWNGLGRTRGMEMSTKPFPEGKPPPARAESWNDRSTICPVPPGEWLDHPVSFTWEKTD